MSEFWAWRPFSIGVKKNKQALGNTKKVLAEASRLRASSPLATYEALDFALEVIEGTLYDVDFWPSETVVLALVKMLEQIYHDEALSAVDETVLSLRPNSRDAIAVREYLRRQIRFIENYTKYMPIFKDHVTKLTRYLMTLIPVPVLIGESEGSLLQARYADLLDDLPETVDIAGGFGLEETLISLNLMEPLRYRYKANVMNVSKIDPRLPPSNPHRYVMPPEAKQSKKFDDEQIVEQYLVGTPFRQFFNTKLPLPLNEQARFEHSHILAGSGHGKTQFIQKWIAQDIEMALQEKRSIVVIDSQGDLIRNIARLECFNPATGALKDKLVIIDPTDVLFPAAINMFAMDEDRLKSYGPVEREKVQNSAIALYEHFFGELLGAELTAKQGVVFKYLARLMLEIPEATILTLRDLVDDPKPFIPYMDKLTGSARVFFAREFLDKSFNQTRKQISKRLWGVLSTPAFERLFSSTQSKIDLFSLMNEGHIILISTAKDLLKQNGASLYGRFFLSMIGQAVMERAVIAEDERTSTYLYIDECQDYFDETVEILLEQGRKFKIGLTLAHQYLDQLDTGGRSSVLANTSIKAAGGMNAKDAKTLATEMGATSDYLQSMKKTHYSSDFAFWMKNDLPNAIKVNVPFGHLERQERMSASEFEVMLEQNRKTYCWRYEAQESSLDVSFPGMEKTTLPVKAAPNSQEARSEPETMPAPEPEFVPPPPMLKAKTKARDIPELTGRGGEAHVHIQNTIKSIANQYGWKADLEYAVTNGSVDVWLEREGFTIACEINVTTQLDYETHNIEKCLAAGADEVWFISEDTDKLATLGATFKDKPNVLCFTPDDVPSEIEVRSDIEIGDQSHVRGFTVSVKRAYTSQADLEVKRARIAHLLKSHKR